VAPSPTPVARSAAPAVASEVETEDNREAHRLEWFTYAVSTGNVAMAEDLYVTKEEMAKVTGEFVDLSTSI